MFLCPKIVTRKLNVKIILRKLNVKFINHPSLFRLSTNKPTELRATGHLLGESTSEFPLQRAGNARSISIMMTSWNGKIFHATGPMCGEFTGDQWNSTQRPVTQSFGVFFDLRLNKRLSKQSLGWWFEMPSGSLWCQCGKDSRLCLQSPHIRKLKIYGTTWYFLLHAFMLRSPILPQSYCVYL